MIATVTTKQVKLVGLTPIMFDRYVSNTAKLSPEQKLYLNDDKIVLPAKNILSFLTAINTESAPKILRDPRKYRALCSAILSSVTITPELIDFKRDGKPIKFKGFNDEDIDPVSNVQIVRDVARLKDGTPNPKERPMLNLPWELNFTLKIFPHPELSLDDLESLMTEGGQRIGLGTFRKRLGKFEFSWN